jgi:cytochrome c oxidase accessory protein FixG
MNQDLRPRLIATRDLSAPASVDLYAGRRKIQPRAIGGFFQHIRALTLWSTLAIYLLLPWATWNGRQALLFDLPARKFYILGWTFLPQDFVFLSWLLIMAAFSLFAVTVLAGRVYCGYVCPQTVWTRIFLFIEHLAEGDRHARLRLDKAPLSLQKILRRGVKHALWLAVAFITAITFVGYFTPARELTLELLQFRLGPWEMFWIAFFSAATYVNAGWLREQVCIYMCPYGRFQSVMFDRDTLIISYDEKRGEARGHRRRDSNPKAQGLGDCIDCELCVQVCPTGIDIRDGLQFECIQCAACIDACDSVMDRMGYARGLVRYTTETILAHGGRYRFFRLRLAGYAVVLGAMATLFVTTLALRVPLEAEALRDRKQLYRETPDGLIENVYLLKVLNKSQHAEQYRVTLQGDANIHLGAPLTLTVAAGEQRSVPVTLSADPGLLARRNYEISFQVRSLQDGATEKLVESRFLAPALR